MRSGELGRFQPYSWRSGPLASSHGSGRSSGLSRGPNPGSLACNEGGAVAGFWRKVIEKTEGIKEMWEKFKQGFSN